MKRKVLLCHYRVGRTDGVSLEIEKRKTMLRSLGYEPITLSGPLNNGADHVIDELEFDYPDIHRIKELAFRGVDDTTGLPTTLLDDASRPLVFWQFESLPSPNGLRLVKDLIDNTVAVDVR